jgi:hypothetical protein
MRKIDFSEPESVAWRRWVKRCQKKRSKVCEAFDRGEIIQVTGLYKSQKPYFASLTGPFMGKCAYCEQYIFSGQHKGDIDHYRPKGGALEKDWRPATRNTGGVDVEHPGYYWLTYDWRNLLLTCIECNQVPEGRCYGKGARFPVLEKRAWRPGEEQDERPLLLNPCVDDPREHLEFDSKTGFLSGKSARGWATIDILGLNERTLPIQRREAYKDVIARFDKIIDEEPADAAEQLRELFAARTRSFTSVARLAFEEQQHRQLRKVGGQSNAG